MRYIFLIFIFSFASAETAPQKKTPVVNNTQKKLSSIESNLREQKEVVDTMEQIVRSMHGQVTNVKKEMEKVRTQIPNTRAMEVKLREMSQAMLELNRKLESIAGQTFQLKQDLSEISAKQSKTVPQVSVDQMVSDLKTAFEKQRADFLEFVQRFEVLKQQVSAGASESGPAPKK